LLEEVERNEERKKEQAAKGFDGLTYFALSKLQEEGVPNAEAVSKNVGEAFTSLPNWRRSEKDLELRKKVTFAIFAEEEDLDKVSALVDRGSSIHGPSQNGRGVK
jgi:type I restriction enzyme R subunit